MYGTRIPASLGLALCLALAACSDGDSGNSGRSSTFVEDYLSDQEASQGTGEAGAEAGIEDRGNQAGSEASKWWEALPREEWSEFTRIETYHPWFEVYKIMDGIFALYEAGQFEEVISWLIIGRRQALLFDTGLGMGDIRGVVKELTSLPILVLNSHGHYDHIGGNHQFRTILGRNLEFSKRSSDGFPTAEVAEYASEDWIWKKHPPNFDSRRYAIQPYQFSRWVDEGQFIDLVGVSLEVVYAPGHAPDGIVLIDNRRRLMFTGDTFYPAPLYAHLEGSDFLQYARTAEKLAARAGDVDHLLMGHNVPVASSIKLLELDAAFKSIIAETANYSGSDGGREYNFDGFSILTRDPPEDDLLLDPR